MLKRRSGEKMDTLPRRPLFEASERNKNFFYKLLDFTVINVILSRVSNGAAWLIPS